MALKAQKKKVTRDVAAAARRSACGRAPTLAMDGGELGRVRVGDFWQGTSGAALWWASNGAAASVRSMPTGAIRQ
jgi:hypothetical protein